MSPTLELVRREPFRALFPLGFVLGAIGVGQWLLFTSGVIERYLGVFHAITQMQGFLLAFAAGFLMTAVPKRTRSAPVSLIELALLHVLLVTIVGAALAEQLALAEGAYAAALLLLVQFAVRRFVGAGAARRPPASFVLVPLALSMGVVAAPLLAWGSRASGPPWALDLGRRLAFEGVFFTLALGVGAFLLPLALRSEAAPDANGVTRATAGYLLVGLAIVASFALHLLGLPRLAFALRGAVGVATLLASRALVLPLLPGWNRRLIWLAALALPAGPLLAAAFPEHEVAAMHVMFVGGFGLLAFAVAAHVTLGHTGLGALQRGRPLFVLAFGALFVAAASVRAIATALPAQYFTLLGIAASLWTAGALVWAVFLVPKMRLVDVEPAPAPP